MIDLHKKIKRILFSINMIDEKDFNSDSFSDKVVRMWKFYCTTNKTLAIYSNMFPSNETYPHSILEYVDALYAIANSDEVTDNENADDTANNESDDEVTDSESIDVVTEEVSESKETFANNVSKVNTATKTKSRKKKKAKK